LSGDSSHDSTPKEAPLLMTKSMRIRKDDMVVVTGGKDRGKTGRVLRADRAGRRVYVEGLNMIKRHQRPRSIKDTQKGAQTGGIIEKEGPIHVSNVMLLDPQENKPTRIGVRVAADGKRERYAKRTGNAID
jgi:large subunit ribosomal protein L24